MTLYLTYLNYDFISKMTLYLTYKSQLCLFIWHLWLYISPLWLYFSKWLYISKCDFIFHNDIYNSQHWLYISQQLWLFIWHLTLYLVRWLYISILQLHFSHYDFTYLNIDFVSKYDSITVYEMSYCYISHYWLIS